MQEVDDPMSDTSIFISDLLYSDGSDATTDDHRWYVNANPPDQKNALNWTDRCSSAGALFNPSKVWSSLARLSPGRLGRRAGSSMLSAVAGEDDELEFSGLLAGLPREV